MEASTESGAGRKSSLSFRLDEGCQSTRAGHRGDLAEMRRRHRAMAAPHLAEEDVEVIEHLASARPVTCRGAPRHLHDPLDPPRPRRREHDAAAQEHRFLKAG
jgi:hypothetical protein